MQRGVIKLNNLELKELCNLVNDSKFAPVKGIADKDHLFDVFVNENEAETILDLMPIPSKDDALNLATARTKLQHFLDKKSA